MLQIHDDIEKLCKEIEVAFSGGIYPGDENIVSCQHNGCSECARIRDLFRGKAWKEVPAAEFRYSAMLADCATMLSDEAFIYFIPALMIASLHYFEYQDHVSSGAAEIMASLAYDFTPPADGIRSSWSRRMSRFSDEQKRVIARYLRFSIDRAYGFKEESSSAERGFEHFSS